MLQVVNTILLCSSYENTVSNKKCYCAAVLYYTDAMLVGLFNSGTGSHYSKMVDSELLQVNWEHDHVEAEQSNSKFLTVFILLKHSVP